MKKFVDLFRPARPATAESDAPAATQADDRQREADSRQSSVPHAPQDEPLIGRRHSDAEAAAFLAQFSPPATGPVHTMIVEAESMKAGSAIRSFTPLFLRHTFLPSDDVQVRATRGKEVLYFTNPTLEDLGKLNASGYGISTQLDQHDTTSACVFRVANRKEHVEYPLYPSMILEDNGELLLVYRLEQVIDRADAPTLFRVKGIVEEVMREKLHADLVASDSLPMAGFFIPQHGKDAVRVVRYGKRYTLGQLIQAFEAQAEIDKRIPPATPTTSPQTQQPPAPEDVLNQVLMTLSALGPFSMFKAPRFTQVTARKLVDAGLDEDTRLKLAPEFFARVQAFEPDWVNDEGLTEAQVHTIFANPEDAALLTPKPKKSRKSTTQKA